jgi:hypothetical protein
MFRDSTVAVVPMVVKANDTHYVEWQLPGFNLTGCTADLILKRGEISTRHPLTITDPPTAGIVRWKLDGTLAVGEYLVEIEVTATADETITTVPSKGHGKLRVERDLG